MCEKEKELAGSSAKDTVVNLRCLQDGLHILNRAMVVLRKSVQNYRMKVEHMPIKGIPHAYSKAHGLFRFIPVRYIREHEIMPKWWGRAWDWYEVPCAVVAPIPLNWILHWAFECWWSFKLGPDRAAERMPDDNQRRIH